MCAESAVIAFVVEKTFDDRVALPGPGARRIGGASPEVDDRLAADGRGEGCTDLPPRREVHRETSLTRRTAATLAVHRWRGWRHTASCRDAARPGAKPCGGSRWRGAYDGTGQGAPQASSESPRSAADQRGCSRRTDDVGGRPSPSRSADDFMPLAHLTAGSAETVRRSLSRDEAWSACATGTQEKGGAAAREACPAPCNPERRPLRSPRTG